MTHTLLYEAPTVEMIETLPEGVLCASNDSGIDMNPEEGIM